MCLCVSCEFFVCLFFLNEEKKEKKHSCMIRKLKFEKNRGKGKS